VGTSCWDETAKIVQTVKDVSTYIHVVNIDRRTTMNRREALAAMGGALVTLTGCELSAPTSADWSDGRIVARPGTPTETPPSGLTTLPFTLGVVGYSYIPPTYSALKPPAFALLFHGAGQGADELMQPLSALAASRNLVLVSITSASATWDLINGPFGADITAIERALTWMFARVAVDPARTGIFGFSDGATYALAVGRANGDLFRRVVAYSPGSLRPVTAVGRPDFFISHGTQDQVLPFATTQNVIVPGLREAGYLVEFREFTGGHGASPALIAETADWFIRQI
jgi:phospholipase/carboxylesterase